MLSSSATRKQCHHLTRRALLGGLGASFVAMGDALAQGAGAGASAVNGLGAALDANGGLIRANGARSFHTDLQLATLAAKVAAGDAGVAAAWASLLVSPPGRATWKPRPSAVITRGGTGPQNYGQMARDAQAAYGNALAWRIGGDTAHGDCARDILNAWAATLTTINGSSDAMLCAGIQGTEFANAAELMRGYPGFDADRFGTMLTTIFHEMCSRFLKEHNGCVDNHYWPNWDLVTAAGVLSIGIFLRDKAKVDEACSYMLTGRGNGSIPNAIPFILKDGTAVWLEACRDQGHTRLGLMFMGAVCEMAWNQGVDLYGAYDQRYLRGAEYIARWNLGNEVAFPTWTWRNGQRAHIDHIAETTFSAASPSGRGLNPAVFGLVRNHYAGRLGRACPNVTEMIGKVGNEGAYEGVGYASLTAIPAAADLSTGRPATQSSTYNGCVAANAVDGRTDGNRNMAPIAHTLHQSRPWWQVDLGTVAQLSTITIWNRTDAATFRWNNAVVMVSATDPGDRSFDHLLADPAVFKRSIGAPTTPSVTLDVRGIAGRYVRVQLPGAEYLNLAEVQVRGWPVAPAPALPTPVQLATFKFASQSSTWDGYLASRAIDGITDGDFRRAKGSHTASPTNPHGSESNPWWQVDLGAVHALEKVTLFNRTDCAPGCGADRWKGGLVFISETDMNNRRASGRGLLWDLQADPNITCRAIGMATDNVLVLNALGLKGRYIRVQLPGDNRNLNLAEVQVTGFPTLS